MLKIQEKLKNKQLLLIRELKRDFTLDGTNTTFNDICDLYDNIRDICMRESKGESDQLLNHKKGQVKKVMQPSKSKSKITNKENISNNEKKR